MCTILFLIPAIKILKNKNIKIFIVLIILILDVNSYNGITTQSDQMLYTPLAKKDTYRLNQVLNAIDHLSMVFQHQ